MLAVWLLQDNDAIPNIEDYDLMSDSEDATHCNYAAEDIKPRLKYNDNPDKMMMKLRNQIIKFAVTGRSYTGKSTFINLVRDVHYGEPTFAETGHGDCTLIPTEYEHPRNSHITLTDLPGFGTDTVTKKKFLESIDLSVFDFVLIFLIVLLWKTIYGLSNNFKLSVLRIALLDQKIDLASKNANKEYVAKVPDVKKRHLSDIRLEAIVTSGLTTTANIGMAVLLSQADSLIPVIGTAIAAKATSVYVSAYLSNALLEMKNDAIAVYEHYTKH
ncbi:unnamed protein product [Mytilus edulis]|uniref:IRG-type G domain-containing protein n=1 Tax=Mytilus edulis TaxID=6550 RepID=A0A8S3Q086_MYTED|nr:unnamed protein product [Mytilus edulis]